MPFSMKIARANRWVVNPVARRFAGRLPPFAIVAHTGRVSGAPYRTPIMAFRTGGGFLIALTYGPETEWVRNIFASGGCALIYGGEEIALAEPALGTIAAYWHAFPGPVRFVLRVMRVTDCLTLRRQSG
jgi:deazaflavin-dependent oxidoreductase (nitroreductase family)